MKIVHMVYVSSMRSWNICTLILLVTTTGCGASSEGPATTPAPQSHIVAIESPPATAASAYETTNDEAPALHSNQHIATPKAHCKYPQHQDPAVGALAWISDCQIKTAQPIHFQFNSPVIHLESEATLQAVTTLLYDDPSLHIEIGAHSDSRGSRQANERLTQERADAIKAHLVAKGIDPGRLIARGFGEDRPISHAPEAEGRRTNRRIEFVIQP